MVAGRKGQIGGELQGALSADEVGLEARAEGIAAPRHAGNTDAGFAQEGVIDGDRERRLRRKLLQHGVTDHGEERISGQTVTREEAIIGGPVVKLLSTGSQQAGDSVTAKAKQTA